MEISSAMPSDDPSLVNDDPGKDIVAKTIGGVFQCGLCKQGFRDAGELQAHIRHHFLTKPFQCGHCASCFDTCAELTLHVNSHNDHAQDSSKQSDSVLSLDLGLDAVLFEDSVKRDRKAASIDHNSSFSLPLAEFPDSSKVKEERQIKYVQIFVPCSECSGIKNVQSYSSEQEDADCMMMKREQNCSCNVSIFKPHCTNEGSIPKTPCDVNNSFQATRKVDHCMKIEIVDNESSGDETHDVNSFMETETDCQYNERVPGNNFSFSRAQIDNAKMTDKSDAAANLEGLKSSRSTEKSSTSSMRSSSVLSRTGPSYNTRNFPNSNGVKKHYRLSNPIILLKLVSNARQCASNTKSALQKALKEKSKKALSVCSSNQANVGSVQTELSNTLPIHIESINNELANQSGTSATLGNKQLGLQSLSTVEKKFCKIQCPHCEVKLSSKRILKKHIENKHGTFKCPICEKILKSKNILLKHIASEHPNEKPFRCEVCCLTFKEQRGLKHHMSSEHPTQKTFRCEVCSTTFMEKEGLKLHIASEHPKKKTFRCKVCSTTFTERRCLKQHMTSEHPNEIPFRCEVCSATFIEQYRLKCHMSTKHSDETRRPFQCEVCSARFKNQLRLTHHMIQHTGEKPFKCKVCSAAFNNEPNLKRHAYVHEEEMPCKCEECPASFTTQYSLRRHRKIVHNSLNPLACPLCPGRLKNEQSLSAHLVNHHAVCSIHKTKNCICKESIKNLDTLLNHENVSSNLENQLPKQPLLCPICGCSFKCSSSLQIHQRVKHGVMGQKRFKCHICSATFTGKGNLRAHVLTHTGLKPHICEVCGRGFSRKIYLRYHLNAHSNSRPIKCTLCGDGFNSATGLRLHNMQHHSAEKTFVCQKCGKRFQLPGNLDRHLLTHTDLRPHSCRYCSKTFRSPSALKYHQRVKHEQDESEIMDFSLVKKSSDADARRHPRCMKQI